MNEKPLGVVEVLLASGQIRTIPKANEIEIDHMAALTVKCPHGVGETIFAPGQWIYATVVKLEDPLA